LSEEGVHDGSVWEMDGKHLRRIMKSAPAKWANPGARILHLYGLLDPSLCVMMPVELFKGEQTTAK